MTPFIDSKQPSLNYGSMFNVQHDKTDVFLTSHHYSVSTKPHHFDMLHRQKLCVFNTSSLGIH